jgi:multicomponent Na+:H+ antiporter subunit E
MLHAIGLGFATFALWLLLSGHFDPLLLSFGVASTIGVVLIALRMEVVDHEAVPLQVRFGFLGYLVWLAAEIAKSNIAVARIILNPKLPISPQMIRVKMSQKSDLGRVTYANSITLTPGTVSVEVEGDEILVHAITREMGEALAEGDMDRRVTAIEGT